jgi:hypothetical protein
MRDWERTLYVPFHPRIEQVLTRIIMKVYGSHIDSFWGAANYAKVSPIAQPIEILSLRPLISPAARYQEKGRP